MQARITHEHFPIPALVWQVVDIIAGFFGMKWFNRSMYAEVNGRWLCLTIRKLTQFIQSKRGE